MVVGFCLGETAMIRYCSVCLSLAFLLAACAIAPQGTPDMRALGAPSAIGIGTAATYAEFEASGAVSAIGVVFVGGALANLPATAAKSDRPGATLGRGPARSAPARTRCRSA